MPHVIVIGSGFAGLWAALGAARRLDELRVPVGEVDITVVSSAPYHDIRVRNYEADLRDCRIPLSELLDPAGIAHITAQVTGIDTAARRIRTATGAVHDYDRLVLASGSHLARTGTAGFDVDTFAGATALDRHLHELAGRDVRPAGAATVVVVGAGLTGIETACELPGRLAAIFGARAAPRVVLVDHNPRIGSDMGGHARPVIEKALADNGVETRTGVRVISVAADQVSLSSGETLPAATVVWCTGMQASPLTGELPVPRDRFGRVAVDDYLRVADVPAVFAAGDVAAVVVDDGHLSVMSCQHGRPMGRFAGYNVIGDLIGEPMLPLRIAWYVTVLDLGPAGAVYTQGWDRQVVAHGVAAKEVKRTINTRRIYPPRGGDRAALLAAAAPYLDDQPAVDYSSSSSGESSDVN